CARCLHGSGPAQPRRHQPPARPCSRERGLAQPAAVAPLALKPTLRHTRAAQYLRPDGPWDVPSLDAVLSAMTRADVEQQVAGVAGGLRAEGVKRGDAVAWQLRNVEEAVLLYRACWRLGAVAVPVHPSASDAEAAAALA